MRGSTYGACWPRPLQRLLNEDQWDADLMRHYLRLRIGEVLGYEPGVGVGFIKKGRHSADVGRQYCGRVKETCRIQDKYTVSISYVGGNLWNP